MKNLTLIIIAALIGFTANAQGTESKLDLRFGIGGSFLGTGGMRTIMFENEANLQLNRYLALGGGLGFAKSHNGVIDQASFLQLNANVYISPFKNIRKNDFRIGTGLSWYSVSDSYQLLSISHNGEIVDSEHKSDKRNSLGFNAVVENTYSVTERLLLGLKLFTQPYQNGDINSGILLKFGVRI